jgi:hypothetical protein
VTSPVPSQPSMADMDALETDNAGVRHDYVHDPEDEILDDLEAEERRLFQDDDDEEAEDGDGEDLFGDNFQKCAIICAFSGNYLRD